MLPHPYLGQYWSGTETFLVHHSTLGPQMTKKKMHLPSPSPPSKTRDNLRPPYGLRAASEVSLYLRAYRSSSSPMVPPDTAAMLQALKFSGCLDDHASSSSSSSFHLFLVLGPEEDDGEVGLRLSPDFCGYETLTEEELRRAQVGAFPTNVIKKTHNNCF